MPFFNHQKSDVEFILVIFFNYFNFSDMPQSLVKNYIHITFSTKYREDTLLKKDLPEIFSYMAGILKNLNCTPIIVGGVSNHIHVLCLLDKTTSVSE